VRKRVLGAEHPDTLSTAGNLAASPVGQGSVDHIQGGSISYAPEKSGISIASTSAAEPASKRAKQSNNRAPARPQQWGRRRARKGGGGGVWGGGRGWRRRGWYAIGGKGSRMRDEWMRYE